MRATELRIGNLVYYHIEDSMDERKEWDKVSPIDYDDLRILTEFKDNSKYKPIPLTNQKILDAGFESMFYGAGYHKNGVEIGSNHNGYYILSTGHQIEFFHQLQNLYFALTGTELTIR